MKPCCQLANTVVLGLYVACARKKCIKPIWQSEESNGFELHTQKRTIGKVSRKVEGDTPAQHKCFFTLLIWSLLVSFFCVFLVFIDSILKLLDRIQRVVRIYKIVGGGGIISVLKIISGELNWYAKSGGRRIVRIPALHASCG